MSDTGPYFAAAKGTHFVHAHKLIAEGDRTYKNMPHDGPDGRVRPVTLLQGDVEGRMIQREGVQALIYSAKLWHDKVALAAVMREGNADNGWL